MMAAPPRLLPTQDKSSPSLTPETSTRDRSTARLRTPLRSMPLTRTRRTLAKPALRTLRSMPVGTRRTSDGRTSSGRPGRLDSGTLGRDVLVENVRREIGEDAVRHACRRILERAGFHVLEASNGPQVLAELADDQVDLLLTDVVMPGGLSGRELAEHLQQDRPDLRVLFMSGYNADAIATRGVLDPGVTVVEKPFTSSDLLGKVRELLS